MVGEGNVSFTTIKVFRRDAAAFKQVQAMLEMQQMAINQSEFMRDLLDFAFRHEREFFREIERIHEDNMKKNEISSEWIKVLAKRMQQM